MKPTGAWGKLYLKDYKPEKVVDTIKYPYEKGVILYDTGIVARIMPNGKVDFLENSGRIILTDGSKGRQYHDLGKLEKSVSKMDNIENCHAYMTYNKENGALKLELEVNTNKDSFLNKVQTYTESALDDSIVPDIVKIIGK